ncbi:MAG: Hsp70 family protein [Pseudonocardiales bacterium]|nr:Hsp70 family protein [Pseudonocardiales bacterium]
MSYWLGIDVGTTLITAAICHTQAGHCARLEVVPLGARSAAVRSMVYLGSDGEVVVGEAAERRAAADPDRVVREFTRRISDEVPVMIDGVRYSAAGLTAVVVSWVIDRVAQLEGAAAQGITVTHPAGWGANTIRAVADALRAADLPEVIFCTGPQAAAVSYSVRERVDVGSLIAVYDLGGGKFEAAVLRKTGASTFSVLGTPEEIERLGGAVFDDVVFGHVIRAVPALCELDPEDTDRLRRSFALCRRECTEAKEALSVHTEVTIPVLFPEVQTQVSLTRAEFEDMIRPQIAETVDALLRALRSAGLGPADLDAVLLVGGSSRVPLIAQLLSSELGRPVGVDPDSQAAIALGGALSGLPAGVAHPAGIDTTTADGMLDTPVRAPVGMTSIAGFEVPELAQSESHDPPWLTDTPLDDEAPEAPWHRARSRRLTRFAAAGFLALVVAGGAASVPFIMAAHRGPTPAPAAATPAPRVRVPATPAPQISVPQTPEVQAPMATMAAIPPPKNTESGTQDSTGADPTTSAEPIKPIDGSARSRAVAPRAGSRAARRPSPPASTTPPPPPSPKRVPEWVETVRS